MHTRIRMIIISMLFAAACTPNPIQDSTPPPDVLRNTIETPGTPTKAASSAPPPIVTEESGEPTRATFIPSLAVEDGLSKKLTQLAIDDLANRLNTDAKGIKVISAEPTVWLNAAFGCPLSDKVYTQGRVPGFQIRLEAGGEIYVYHTDRTGIIILCPKQPDEPGLR